MAEATSVEKSDPLRQRGLHTRVADLFFRPLARAGFSGKAARLCKAIEAFRAHARFWDPPLEIVRIPFEGSGSSAICGCEKCAGPRALVLAISAWIAAGRSVRKLQRICLTASGFSGRPGQARAAPINSKPDSGRMFSRVLDYLQPGRSG